jgi:hypothetical protein
MSEFMEFKRKKLCEHSAHTELHNFTSLHGDAAQKENKPFLLKVKITSRISLPELFCFSTREGAKKVYKELIKKYCPVSNYFLPVKRPYRPWTLNQNKCGKF